MKKLVFVFIFCHIFVGVNLILAQNCDTTSVSLNRNVISPPNPPHWPRINVSCLDSAIQINVFPYISCSSIAANGSNFSIDMPNGTKLIPSSAHGKNCVGDSTNTLLVQFNQPFFVNMVAPFWVGQSNTGVYIASACAKKPWRNDSIQIVVESCFTTNVEFTNIDQKSSSEVVLTWKLDDGTIYAPFPKYLFGNFQIYRKTEGETQFQFIDSVQHVDATNYIDRNLPNNYIGTLTYKIAANVLHLELAADTTSVQVILKTAPVAFPVPFQKELNIALGGDEEKEISIFSIDGKLIFSTKTTDFFLVIQTDAWPKGVYFIRVRGKEEETQKIVKF